MFETVSAEVSEISLKTGEFSIFDWKRMGEEQNQVRIMQANTCSGGSDTLDLKQKTIWERNPYYRMACVLMGQVTADGVPRSGGASKNTHGHGPSGLFKI